MLEDADSVQMGLVEVMRLMCKRTPMAVWTGV
jgi:hypothetical protein